MPLPVSGTLTLSQIRDQYSGSNPVNLGDYRSGGPRVPANTIGSNGPIPSSGLVRVSDFYGSPQTATGLLSGNWTLSEIPGVPAANLTGAPVFVNNKWWITGLSPTVSQGGLWSSTDGVHWTEEPVVINSVTRTGTAMRNIRLDTMGFAFHCTAVSTQYLIRSSGDGVYTPNNNLYLSHYSGWAYARGKYTRIFKTQGSTYDLHEVRTYANVSDVDYQTYTWQGRDNSTNNYLNQIDYLEVLGNATNYIYFTTYQQFYPRSEILRTIDGGTTYEVLRSATSHTNGHIYAIAEFSSTNLMVAANGPYPTGNVSIKALDNSGTWAYQSNTGTVGDIQLVASDGVSNMISRLNGDDYKMVVSVDGGLTFQTVGIPFIRPNLWSYANGRFYVVDETSKRLWFMDV
jgi:hypothetical protein